MPRTFDPALWSRFDREESATAVLPTVGRHSMDSPEWYTPSPFVEAARETMGGIDLDPFSHEEANRTVKATRFFTEADNGLVQRWTGRLFINPPGGLVAEAWINLVSEPTWDQAIWVGYSLEQLQTLQRIGAAVTPLDFPMCVPNKRIAFVENEAKKAQRIEKLIALGKSPNAKSTPSHANYIVHLGIPTEPDIFEQHFRQFGQVTRRARA